MARLEEAREAECHLGGSRHPIGGLSHTAKGSGQQEREPEREGPKHPQAAPHWAPREALQLAGGPAAGGGSALWGMGGAEPHLPGPVRTGWRGSLSTRDKGKQQQLPQAWEWRRCL